ncbi:hypothetical protein AA23498_1948 [Acetobacter nitrogenifigens DSM 23921 = NBRC 105050]|uniref:Uncharacterized protein n=1 Tax=Acetobacter nitrogenifigens DSM 23921 = NBRC 105050 TaxID=1120919 RepID=A0A511XC62_9PROT|nr:hypothetical protein AA23498_1948 [Acetobacter nitrogenifigens DSM 23921 = NBRC 105050]GEN60546.1 hypothetical protein ANI02nite_24300 [Acetobacter nitrogenifigens DSM 23921 = NBRC 105050]
MAVAVTVEDRAAATAEDTVAAKAAMAAANRAVVTDPFYLPLRGTDVQSGPRGRRVTNGRLSDAYRRELPPRLWCA